MMQWWCVGDVAATVGDGAVEITFNHIDNSTMIRCRHYGVLDVHTGKYTCLCPRNYLLAHDGVNCIGITQPLLYLVGRSDV